METDDASPISMAALEAAIQVFWERRRACGSWMAGSGPAMESGSCGALTIERFRKRGEGRGEGQVRGETVGRADATQADEATAHRRRRVARTPRALVRGGVGLLDIQFAVAPMADVAVGIVDQVENRDDHGRAPLEEGLAGTSSSGQSAAARFRGE